MIAAPEVDAYDAVVLGSATHNGDRLPEVSEYLRRHAPELGRRPVWLFSVSLLGHRSSALNPWITRWPRPRLKAIAETRAAVRPRDHRALAGKVVSHGSDGDHVSQVGRVGLEPTTEGL
jgi:menaquinone-dependent protoporphyrinogen oxidase